MEFFVGNNSEPHEVSLTDFMLDCHDRIQQASFGELREAVDPELLRELDPHDSGVRLAALAEERSHDDGNMKGCEFRKVASFTNVPLFEALRIQEGLLRGKKEFYALLKKYPQYRCYDRRGRDHPTETFVNGVPA